VKKHPEWYRQIIENSLLAIYIFQDGHFIYHNPRVQELTGYSSKELDDMSLEQLIHPQDLSELVRYTQQALQGDTTNLPIPYQFRVIYKDGAIRWAEIIPTLIEVDGKPAILGNAIDITEQKRAEEALRESEGFLRTLFDTVLDGILILDYSGKILNYNSILAKMFGLKSTNEAIGRNALEFILPKFHSAVIKDLANVKEGQGGYLNSYKVKSMSGKEFWVEGLGTDISYNGKHVDLVSIRDITERKKAADRLEHSFVDLAETVSRAMASRDPYTSSHQRKVAELTRLVGKKMGLDKDRLMGLYIGGLLHDIGKISTPETILTKPGSPSEEEWALIHAHAMRGYEILDGSRFPWPVAEMTLHHHERLDGSGYPDGISGDELSLEVRILAVCDVVEAMSSFRPYRPARSKEEVLEELRSGKGTKYDPAVVDVMLEIIESGEFEIAEAK